jgi:hypothetical protein
VTIDARCNSMRMDVAAEGRHRAGTRNLAVGRRAIERARVEVEAATGPTQHLIDPQGASLLVDESQVMGQMLDATVDHLAHRPIAPIANDSRPLPCLR